MGIFNQIGILGINARNLLYVRPYNKKKAVRMADDKLKTKQFLSARDIPVPKLYAAIRSQEELERFDFASLPGACVLKPNLGFGGEGIIPFIGRKDGGYEKASGTVMSQAEVTEHIGDVLDGRFSLAGVADSAFFEQLIVCDDSLAKFAYKGLPDIRIVVHNLIPVMAMLRLPTRESDGKANLHQGAIGVGIDIARGTATHIVHHNKIIDEVPEFGEIRGVKIPYWDEMLLAASKVQLVTNLGYMAVDMAIDRNVGPVLLEINARAGLAVQIANLAPLRKRLERIQGVKVSTPEKGVRIAQDMFGNKLDKEVKKISGKEVIGSLEKVKFLVEGDNRYVWASINPLLERTLIDRNLAEDLALPEQEDSELVKVKFMLAEQRIQTLAQPEDLSGKGFDLVIGRRELSSYLIDPSKGKDKAVGKLKKLPHIKPDKAKHSDAKSAAKVDELSGVNFLELDSSLVSIDRQIKLLYHLKPVNLEEEKAVFMKDVAYNPQFKYPDTLFDVFHLKEKVAKVKVQLDDSPLGKLFAEKAAEILKKIALVEVIGTENLEPASLELYGDPDERLMAAAKEKLDAKPKHFEQGREVRSLEEAIIEFETVFEEYGLDWKIKVKKEMVTDCVAGKKNAVFLREGAKFEEDRLRMLVAHEIETHVLTAENGKQQNYQLFNRGFANYLETQEGLAIWNQEQVLAYDVSQNYRSASLLFVLDFARKHGFAETYDYCLKLGMKKEEAFKTTLKFKRGFEDTSKPGAFTKDAVYFSGYLQVRDFVAQGGDLRDLYYGKYNLRDIQKVKAVRHLKEPKVLPKFLL